MLVLRTPRQLTHYASTFQTGGHACFHPMAEGVHIPLNSDDEPEYSDAMLKTPNPEFAP